MLFLSPHNSRNFQSDTLGIFIAAYKPGGHLRLHGSFRYPPVKIDVATRKDSRSSFSSCFSKYFKLNSILGPCRLQKHTRSQWQSLFPAHSLSGYIYSLHSSTITACHFRHRYQWYPLKLEGWAHWMDSTTPTEWSNIAAFPTPRYQNDGRALCSEHHGRMTTTTELNWGNLTGS